MKCWTLWSGGYNYMAPTIEENLEEFESLKLAKFVFQSRIDGWDPVQQTVTPCVEGPEMSVFFKKPTIDQDAYPDLLITVGPRGGIKTERC